jgi:hypothetical protein
MSPPKERMQTFFALPLLCEVLQKQKIGILKQVHWLVKMRKRQFGGTRHRWKGRIKIGLKDEKIGTAFTWLKTGTSDGLM